MKVPFTASAKKAEDVAYEKMENENESNEQVQSQEQSKGLVATLVTKKVDSCCLNPKNCRLVTNPISQKVIEVVKGRLN